MFCCLLWAIAAAVRPKVLLIADNLCLRQRLLVLTAAPQGCGPAILGSGMPVVRGLANLCAHCETRNRAALAPSRVADLFAPAFQSQREDGSPADCAGTTDPDPAHDHREPTLRSAEESGGTGEAWVQSFGQDGSQVYASNPSSRAIFPLAVISEAARIDRPGVRFLLTPIHV